MTFENYLDVDVFVKNCLDVEDDDDDVDFDVDGDVEGRITMRELDTMSPLARGGSRQDIAFGQASSMEQCKVLFQNGLSKLSMLKIFEKFCF